MSKNDVKPNVTKHENVKPDDTLRDTLVVRLQRPAGDAVMEMGVCQTIATYRILSGENMLADTNSTSVENISTMQARYPDIIMCYGRTNTKLFTKEEIEQYTDEVAHLAKAMGKAVKQQAHFYESALYDDLMDVFGTLKGKFTHKGKKMSTADLQLVFSEYCTRVGKHRHESVRLLKDINTFERMLNAYTAKVNPS